LRKTETQETGIRVSPWKLNLVAKQVRNLTVQEAYAQTLYSKKHQARNVYKTLAKAATEMEERYGLLPEELMVAEAFATMGTRMKRVRIMGRGYHGVEHRKFAHLTVRL
ncbi:unnamed protein product, partial [Heterosigma akashiwo]